MTVIVTDKGFQPAPAREIVALADLTNQTAVDLSNTDDPDLLADKLDQITLIRVAFPAFSDGRAFTIARRLRTMGYAGQLLALCFTVLPLWRHGVDSLFLGAWPGWVMPFVLFRLFDIWKPWLVGRADRRGDAVGVMLDDLWAGLFAGISSGILAGVYHGVLQPWLNG